MPFFLAAVWVALIQMAGTLVGKVLVSLGIGFVEYTALDASLNWLKATIAAQWSGIGADTLQVASTMRLGTGVSILISAIGARLVLDGMTAGKIKRMVVK